jgi:hypothetical protein
LPRPARLPHNEKGRLVLSFRAAGSGGLAMLPITEFLMWVAMAPFQGSALGSAEVVRPHRPRHTAIIHRQWSEHASSDKEGSWIPHHSASELGGGSYNRPYFRNGRSGVLHLLRRDARGLATFATSETLWKSLMCLSRQMRTLSKRRIYTPP